MSSSSSRPPSSDASEGGGEIISLAGLWSHKVREDARALSSSFGKRAALDFLVEETKNVEQVVAGGVHEVRKAERVEGRRGEEEGRLSTSREKKTKCFPFLSTLAKLDKRPTLQFARGSGDVKTKLQVPDDGLHAFFALN